MKHLFLLVIAVGCAAESAGSRDGIPDAGEREVRFPPIVDDHTVKVLGRDAGVPEFDAGEEGGAGAEAPLPDAGLLEEDAGSDAAIDAMVADVGEDPLEHQCEPCVMGMKTAENPGGFECPENYSCAASHQGADICAILADDAGVCPHPSLVTRGPTGGLPAPNPGAMCLPTSVPAYSYGPCDEWLEMYWGP